MKAIILMLLCVVCLSATAQEQWEYRYWFDTSEQRAEHGSTTEGRFSIEVDASALSAGPHTLHYQLLDTVRGDSQVKSALFEKIATGRNEYTILVDGKPHGVYAADGDSLHIELDANELQLGLHTIGVLLSTDNTVVSSKEEAVFMKLPTTENLDIATMGVNCLIDDKPYAVQQIRTDGTTMLMVDLDVDTLSYGLHTISMQLVSRIGLATEMQEGFFMRMPKAEMSIYCFVDDRFYRRYEVEKNGSPLIHLDLDANDWGLGVHKLTIQAITADGVASTMEEGVFMKVPTDADIDDMSIHYFIDDKIAGKSPCAFADGIAHADLDMAALTNGFHTITFAMSNTKGLTTQTKTAFFIKNPLGGNGIVAYEYWIDEHRDEKTTKRFETPQETAAIIELFEVPHYPIRSASFHFAVEEEQPVIYAKNTLHASFQDAYGYILFAQSQFIDVTSRTVVDDESFRVLQSGVQEKIEQMEENEIVWYKFEAEKGDSISIRADKSCTIELFLPNGELLQKSEGYKAVQSLGLFIPEDGTYYVAVHDNKSSAEAIEIDFHQIAKYAIIDYDVHTVGNGGFTTITFNGNGFYSLDSLNLTWDDKVIPCAGVKRLSNTRLEATFDFGGVPTETYDMNFYYLDKTLRVAKGIRVTEATDILLTNSIKYASTFLMGNEAQYNITLTNKGNNTAYRVPVYIYIETKLSDGVPRITLQGFDIPSYLANVDMEQFTADEQALLKKMAQETGDNLNFIRAKEVNPESGDSVMIHSNYFFVDVPPLTTKKFAVCIASLQEVVECYTTIPEEWIAFTERPVPMSARSRELRSQVKDQFCCIHEKVECALNAINYIVGTYVPESLAQMITECATSGLSTLSSFTASRLCSDDTEEENNKFYDGLMSTSNVISVGSSIKDCLFSKFDFKRFQKWYELIRDVNGVLDAYNMAADCRKTFTTKKPGCPPVPPKGGDSTPVRSYDPNDILGYVAQSGSHYVGFEQKRLEYTIEFENDSTLATASAHTIALVDTLETDIFDINSIHTSKVVIGKHEVEVDKYGEFVATIDFRPAINALAEVALRLGNDGEIVYSFTSLDPMTIEPTQDIMAGILPKNNDEGDGEGYVVFDVQLRNDLDDGTLISNKASIVFDNNEAIVTPAWENETDYVLPASYVCSIDSLSDVEHIRISIDGFDNRSGIWKYALYYQIGSASSWDLVDDNIVGNTYEMKVFRDIDYGFCVIATDMAGNKEAKEMTRELSYINGNTVSDIKTITADDVPQHRRLYDLQGRRVHGKPQPGIYVMKGKKVVIK